MPSPAVGVVMFGILVIVLLTMCILAIAFAERIARVGSRLVPRGRTMTAVGVRLYGAFVGALGLFAIGGVVFWAGEF